VKVLILSRMLNDQTKVPYDELPHIAVGEPFQFSSIEREKLQNACPAFPISFVHGVPILHTIDGYAPAGGLRRPLTSIVSLLKNRIAFRTKIIEAPQMSSEQLIKRLDELKNSPDWYFKSETWLFGTRDEHDAIECFAGQIDRYIDSRLR